MLMKQRGISMIEILVTLTIVAFGLLGLLGLQARALSFQKDSFDRKAAAELATQLAERMRGNHVGFAMGGYITTFEPATATPAAVTTCAAPCTFAQVATRDMDEWRIELRRRMPGSAAYVAWDAANPVWVDISIAWAEPQAAGADAVCDALRLAGAVIPANYRCYQTRVFP
jgi:type IV pilus assembly protein PilV